MKYLRRKNLEKAHRFYTIPFWELDSRIEEISRFNLNFPYHLRNLMYDILRDYKIFSIEGYEEYYSQQEQELIERLIRGLKEQDGKE